MDGDWQREVGQRLEGLAVDGERKRELLAEVHTETLCQQDRLLHTVRDMHGWKVREREHVSFPLYDQQSQISKSVHRSTLRLHSPFYCAAL